MILGLDFIQKYQVDCSWKRGVLCLKGDEAQAYLRYTTGDGRAWLKVSTRTVLPAYSQVVVDVRVQKRGPGSLPDWGMVSPARKPVSTFGMVPRLWIPRVRLSLCR
jgi:hypothetical protein